MISLWGAGPTRTRVWKPLTHQPLLHPDGRVRSRAHRRGDEAHLWRTRRFLDARPDQAQLVTLNRWNEWTEGRKLPFVTNGDNSKPTFDRFGGIYYLGWQERTRIDNCRRGVFNIDVSWDGSIWERKYRFESPNSFQYPTFHEHEGAIWLSVTQSDHKGSTDRIMFGKLDKVSRFEQQVKRGERTLQG